MGPLILSLSAPLPPSLMPQALPPSGEPSLYPGQELMGSLCTAPRHCWHPAEPCSALRAPPHAAAPLLPHLCSRVTLVWNALPPHLFKPSLP